LKSAVIRVETSCLVGNFVCSYKFKNSLNRETGGGRITAVSPIDGEGWLETIRALARSNRPERQSIRAECERYEAPARSNYFAEVSGFLETL
jgi:hypothetical protein